MCDVNSVVFVVTVNGLIAKSFDHHQTRLAFNDWVKGLTKKAMLHARRGEEVPLSGTLTTGNLVSVSYAS